MRSNIYTPSPDKWLLREVLKTHASLRFGIGIIAMFFPLLLWLIGCLFGLHMPPSISEYYWHPYTPHAIAGGYLVEDAPVRVFFVGGLWAIGVFLICYRGYTRGENHLHTLAGLCAISVATFPMNPCCKHDPVCPIKHLGNFLYGLDALHFGSAVGLFVCLSIAIFLYSNNTLRYFGNPLWEGRLRRFYHAIAVLMLAVPAITYLTFHGVLDRLLPGENFPHLIYWMEVFAIVPFGLFWLVKTTEIRLSEYDHMLGGPGQPM